MTLNVLFFIASERIHVNGCMDVIRGVLFKHVMPILMICALVGLVVGMMELLLLLCAACFADHIRKSDIIAITQARTEKKLSMESPGIDRSRIMDDVDDDMQTGYMEEHIDERKLKQKFFFHTCWRTF